MNGSFQCFQDQEWNYRTGNNLPAVCHSRKLPSRDDVQVEQDFNNGGEAVPSRREASSLLTAHLAVLFVMAAGAKGQSLVFSRGVASRRQCHVHVRGNTKGLFPSLHVWISSLRLVEQTETHRTKYKPTYICCIYMQNSCCQHISIHGQKQTQVQGRI